MWNADKVKVTGDVTVADGVTLTIAPGVVVEFQDHYRLAVQGALWAVGTPAERILFTTDEPALFQVDASLTGCWNGIEFVGTKATNEPSRLEYCVIEYGKAVAASGAPYEYGGGALLLYDFSDLTLARCIVRHNVALYGGALFLYHGSSPEIAGNLFTDNHALGNASVLYCGYSYPRLVNNTAVKNPIHNETDPYIDTCAALSFLAKPRFQNDVFVENDPAIPFLHSQLWQEKSYYTKHNVLEGCAGTGLNLAVDPAFVDLAAGDLRLTAASPCVNRGLDEGAPAEDLDGLLRPVMGSVDIGAYEYSAAHRLEADAFAVSAVTGGVVHLALHGGTAGAGRDYLVFASLSGTVPGTPLPGGAVLPLNWDSLTSAAVPLANTPLFAAFLGQLDAAGDAAAQLAVPPVPGAAGIVVHLAYALWPGDFASNPISVAIAP
ncbi:MAG: right-handed parallel beta-helix repeat-containing protein [Planctomycetes bacterium]|nr:right-handed parallel beta-helix repeat-containing protein [Planctomycetota bacterium]